MTSIPSLCPMYPVLDQPKTDTVTNPTFKQQLREGKQLPICKVGKRLEFFSITDTPNRIPITGLSPQGAIDLVAEQLRCKGKYPLPFEDQLHVAKSAAADIGEYFGKYSYPGDPSEVTGVRQYELYARVSLANILIEQIKDNHSISPDQKILQLKRISDLATWDGAFELPDNGNLSSYNFSLLLNQLIDQLAQQELANEKLPYAKAKTLELSCHILFRFQNTELADHVKLRWGQAVRETLLTNLVNDNKALFDRRGKFAGNLEESLAQIGRCYQKITGEEPGDLRKSFIEKVFPGEKSIIERLQEQQYLIASKSAEDSLFSKVWGLGISDHERQKAQLDTLQKELKHQIDFHPFPLPSAPLPTSLSTLSIFSESPPLFSPPLPLPSAPRPETLTAPAFPSESASSFSTPLPQPSAPPSPRTITAPASSSGLASLFSSIALAFTSPTKNDKRLHHSYVHLAFKSLKGKDGQALMQELPTAVKMDILRHIRFGWWNLKEQPNVRVPFENRVLEHLKSTSRNRFDTLDQEIASLREQVSDEVRKSGNAVRMEGEELLDLCYDYSPARKISNKSLAERINAFVDKNPQVLTYLEEQTRAAGCTNFAKARPTKSICSFYALPHTIQAIERFVHAHAS